MLTLMLLRHAKSSWSEIGQDDRNRPLDARGKLAAPAMGAYMADHRLIPQLVLCSPATRAEDTWSLVAAELKASPTVLIEPTLYDFGDGEALLDCLRFKGGPAQTVLLVGHNPSIANLAGKLAGKGNDKLRERLDAKFPTAALAVIGFHAHDWKALTAGCGTLLNFVTPKELL
jgi:phosphohistidine phosphatase